MPTVSPPPPPAQPRFSALPHRSTLQSPTHACPPGQPPQPPQTFPLPPCPGTGTGTGMGMSQPMLPARGTPASFRPRCQPRAGWHTWLPGDSAMRSLPCPSSAAAGAVPPPAPRRAWVAVGFPSASPAAGQADTTTGHPQLHSCLPEIRLRRRWVSQDVLSLRACQRQRSAMAHGIHMQQHPP